MNKNNLCLNIPISKNLDVHESELAFWNTVVFTATTTALLFYHMSYIKSISMKRSHAAIFAIALIFSSVLFNLYSLYNYFKRTKILNLNSSIKCVKKDINESRIIYSFITGIVLLVQIGICINISLKEFKFFRFIIK